MLGRDADVLRIVPAIVDSPWRRILLSVDREHCVAMRAEFQDNAGPARRYEATASSLKSAGKYWYAEQGIIDDLRHDVHSQLSIKGVSTDRVPASSLFDPKNLQK